MWQTIRRYLKEGYRSFSFGKTEHGHKGLLQFKHGWGTEEKVLLFKKFF
jgi:hypothetical protein